MKLMEWDKEPRTYSLMTCYCGKVEKLEDFFAQWFSLRGNLDLQYAELDPAAYAAILNGGRAHGIACAFFIPRPPSYGLLGWIMRQPGWKLFYRVSENGGATGDATASPAGLFFPWGLTTDGPPLLDNNGRHARIVNSKGIARLPSEEKFHPLASLLEKESRDGLSFTFENLIPVTGKKAEKADKTPMFQLPLRLVQSDRLRAPDAAERVASRLKKEINSLTERLETMLWWMEKDEPEVWMHIYPETDGRQPGSSADLKRWFASATDEALGQFLHSRIVLEDLGALHIVVPADCNRVPASNPPPAMVRLKLDPKWKRKGRDLYLPPDLQLWPPPPRNNAHAEKLLADSLWENESQQMPLAILEIRRKEYRRFVVEDFKPLREQAAELNVQVGIEWSKRKFSEESPDFLKIILENVRKSTRFHILNHKAKIEEELDRLWDTKLRDLRHYREMVRQGIDDSEEIRKSRKAIEAFKQREWSSWSRFFSDMTALDRELISKKRKELKKHVETLDSVRRRMADMGRFAAPDKKRELARELRRIAAWLETEPQQ